MDFYSAKMISFSRLKNCNISTSAAVKWLMALVFLLPAMSYGLGLGPITMKSALNQPLLAEIDLHSVQAGDLDGLVVKMASSEDFKRISVEKTGFLAQIDFAVKKHNDGSPYIQLSTSNAVTEPYLDFLIEARWPRGRALKEYTVLVDPPVLTAEAPAPVQQAQVAPVFAKKSTPPRRTTPRRSSGTTRFKPINKPKPAPIPDPEPIPEPEPIAEPEPEPEEIRQIAEFEPEPEAREEPGSLSHGVIRRGETLSEIAADMKPSDVTLQQMMLALLKSNPAAFINGNINRMRAGATLRINDPTILAELSRSEAFAEVQRQNREWRRGRRAVQQVASAGASSFEDDDLGSSGSGSSVAQSEARLKLVAPGSKGLGTGGSVEDSKEAQQLREDLLLATEALDANKQESAELKSRVNQLEEQLESMQRLINLKDQEMASLQSNLKKQLDNGEIAPSADNTAQKPKPQQVVSAKPDEFADDDLTFLSDQTIMALVVFLVVAVIAWLVIRRRKMHDGFEESILNIGGVDDDMMSAQSFGNSFGSQAQSVGSMASAFGVSEMNTGIEADTTEVDPISEADVYLAYGRHQQAEDILKQAIQQDDTRLDVHAKLMEVYNAAGNQKAFESHAQFMFDRVGGDESNEYWQKVAQMGLTLCPQNPLFGGGGGQPSAAVDSTQTMSMDMDMDMDLDMGLDMDTGTDNSVTSAADEDLLDFEFDTGTSDLDLDASGGNSAADDGSLDFDVSSLDFNLDDNISTGVENVDAELAVDDDDNSLDFDMGVSDMDTSDADVLDFDGLDLDSLSTAENEAAPIDLVESDADDLGMGLELEGLDSGLDGDEPIELTLDDDALDLEEVSDIDEVGDFDTSSDLTGEFDEDIFANVDEIGSKLDLAKAYVDMGDSDGARSILDEVMEEGDDTQKEQAQQLLSQMG